MSRATTGRRDFLKTSAQLGTAAWAAPYVWSSSYAKAQSANDGLNVLTIGVRGRGGGVGRSAGLHGRVVAVCDVDTASADRFFKGLLNQQESKPELYKDYRQALERKDIDVVTIGTPDHWHTAILIAAMKAGKDIYCEKPMTLTIDEGKLICKVARETGRVVQVGTQQRTEFGQRFLRAAAIARSGRLGKKLTATCSIGTSSSGGPFPTGDPPATLDWDFWLGQTPKVPYCPQRCHGSFRWWLEYSGGKMTDWGAHHIDIAQWAVGAENTGPVEIEGEGDFPQRREQTLAMITGKIPPTAIPNGYNAVTAFRVRLKFAGGNTIVVRHGPGNGILIEGEKGRIEVSRGRLVGAPIEQIQADEAEARKLDAEVVKLYKGKQPGSHMENFIQSVRDRSQPISDVFTHHRAVSSCHLCNIVLLLGRKLKWDPAKEDFIGDPEASAMRSRKQRVPYTIEA
jgi:predicted dehydrogenase